MPGVTAVEAQETADGRIVLRFTDGSFKIGLLPRFVSDGTIKMFAYLVCSTIRRPIRFFASKNGKPALSRFALKFSPRSSQLILGEAVRFLCRLTRRIFYEVPLDSIFWLRKQSGLTTVHRARDDLVEGVGRWRRAARISLAARRLRGLAPMVERIFSSLSRSRRRTRLLGL